MAKLDDVIIQSVIFGENGVEIAYAERREQSEIVSIFKTIAIDIEVVAVEVGEALESLHDALERGLVALHNPPTKIGAVDEDDE